MNYRWYKGIVLKGNKIGRTINYPTVNLDPIILAHFTKEGVWACTVKYEDKNYQGALYLGPRLVLKETKRVLEVHILDFQEEIYDKLIFFHIHFFVRGVRNFDSFQTLQKQLKADIERIKMLRL